MNKKQFIHTFPHTIYCVFERMFLMFHRAKEKLEKAPKTPFFVYYAQNFNYNKPENSLDIQERMLYTNI